MSHMNASRPVQQRDVSESQFVDEIQVKVQGSDWGQPIHEVISGDRLPRGIAEVHKN